VDLRESALHRPRIRVEALASSGHQPQHDDDRFVVGEHQGREAIAGPDAIAAADSPLSLDGDPKLLEGRDVAPDRPRIDREPVGDLAPGRQRPGLEKLEQLEEPGGRGLHNGH
jgi:hypothetical protein